MSEFSHKLKLAEKLAGRGKLSRREFFHFAIAAGLTVAAAESLFVLAVRAQPKKGGLLKMAIGHGATTDSLDPATYSDQFTGTALWGTLSNSLTEIDAKGEAVGDLAETIEPSDGAAKWIVKLRKGVTFHNGKTLTAEDVVGSIQHHVGAQSKSAARSLVASIASIKADGPDTVIIHLDAGNADLPYYLSDYHIPIMPVIDGKVDWASGDRTGPYVLESFDPGVRAMLMRNPNYHKPDRAHFDGVEVVAILDVAGRTNALTSGEIHYMDRCDLKTLNLLKKNEKLVISEVTGYGHHVYVMNVTVPPFDNVHVRTALKYSLDRDEIVRKVFLGHGVPGNDNPIAPSVKFAVDPQPRHVYDPDKAKSYLKKAGFETIKVDLSAADAAFAGCVDSAILWKEHAIKAGIDLNLVREPDDGYWDNVWSKKPFVAGYWAGRPTCDWMFTAVYAADAAWNETSWKHPRFDELLVTARSETDNGKRAALYAEMQQIVHDDGGLINLMFSTYVDAHVNTLAHGDVAANWPMDGMRIAERWWFA